jgi:hypothetical protein
MLRCVPDRYGCIQHHQVGSSSDVQQRGYLFQDPNITLLLKSISRGVRAKDTGVSSSKQLKAPALFIEYRTLAAGISHPQHKDHSAGSPLLRVFQKPMVYAEKA